MPPSQRRASTARVPHLREVERLVAAVQKRTGARSPVSSMSRFRSSSPGTGPPRARWRTPGAPTAPRGATPVHRVPGPAGPDHTCRSREGSHAVADVVEISATPEQGFEDAIRQGLERASKTLRGVTSAWVKDQRVKLEDGRIAEYQVNMEVTFVLGG